MRRIAIVVWLLLPIAALAYHLGPGQKKALMDEVDHAVRQAERLAENQQWAKAVASYDHALSLLPPDKKQAGWQIRIEKAKAQMFASQLPAANSDLKALVDEVIADGTKEDEPILDEARAALANSQYYRTWLMRLEGLPKDVWEPEIESARQIYRLLAESANEKSSKKRYEEDLESTIRLARMDVSDLQGLPLPSQ